MKILKYTADYTLQFNKMRPNNFVTEMNQMRYDKPHIRSHMYRFDVRLIASKMRDLLMSAYPDKEDDIWEDYFHDGESFKVKDDFIAKYLALYERTLRLKAFL